ncbi:MAG: sugar phosphate isomerase/epimerase [Lentisphaerae bacterium]|jgi:L-ribulose-5-phosphate 3-epimerase|nr:sugar phosphate isomerase/epimerase [Lentisphaerota bacterium]MBT4818973.1 sugar phosphate isomerase/epimerase [Lentisphaerota bacterium]MBT5608934.1 sugar phosphate isomerase/epimerase [Lentisphaerota bacterium]MBT7055593.1 sugar phosphate isomerase/epimerase [Lentisphaerota bacterium]MBT7845552.1 sugar phosphate isomerase/epimerase [Lentisphaerota bacterium]
MRIGISQLVLPKLSMADFLRGSAAAGYDAVELSLRPDSPIGVDASDADIAAVVALAAELGLTIESMTINHCTGNLLDSGEAQERSIAETRDGLKLAAAFGAPCALHTLGRFGPDLYYDDAYRNAVTALQELAGTAEELGVAIAVEFVWSGFLFSPMEMKQFLDDVASEYVGFYFDPGNMAVFQFPHHWVRIVGSHIKRVHLKDWQGRALNGGWTPLLEGEVDFAAMMKELHGIGYAGPLISEVPPSLAPLADTAAAIRKIRDL